MNTNMDTNLDTSLDATLDANRLNRSRRRTADPAALRRERPAIFGLRYIEEEAAEIHDVVGCLMSVGTATGCDDHDQLA